MLPLPDLFTTEFWCEGDYKVPVSTASQYGGSVKANTMRLPFRPGGSSAFPALTFLGPGSESTLQPTGYSVLLNANAYQSFRVLWSEIRVRISGANSSNNVAMVILPVDSASSTPADIYHARTQRYAKAATFNVSKLNEGCDREGYLTIRLTGEQLLGITRAEQKGDYTSIVSSYNLDPLVNTNWIMLAQTTDLDVTGTTASILQVRLRWRVELLNLWGAGIPTA